MARRKETEGETEQAKPSEVRKMPGKGAYKAILDSIRVAKKDVSSIAGTVGTERKAFLEKWGFNPKALRVLAMMDAMENEKLRDFIDCLDHGREVRGLNDRAASVQPMEFGEGEEGEEDESAGAEQGHRRNVRQFPAPPDVAAE